MHEGGSRCNDASALDDDLSFARSVKDLAIEQFVLQPSARYKIEMNCCRTRAVRDGWLAPSPPSRNFGREHTRRAAVGNNGEPSIRSVLDEYARKMIANEHGLFYDAI
jgi:hypothetical protein